LAALGVAAVFPMPLCSLTEEHSGFDRWTEPYHSPLIARFARHFGRPRFTLKIDTDGRGIEEATNEALEKELKRKSRRDTLGAPHESA